MVLKDDKPPVDFCYLDTRPEYRLSRFERLTLTGGAELERAVSWIARRLARLSPSASLRGFDIEEVFEAAQFYTSPIWQKSPEAFFSPPGRAPVSTSVGLVHGLSDGDVVDLSFPSAYELQNPGFAEEYSRLYPENNTVHVRWWRHHARPSPTLIGIHGWTMGDQRLNSLTFLPGVFYRIGFDVALIELPYHGRRRPSAVKEQAEELFPSSHMVRTNEAMGQVISDLRSLRLYLEEYGSAEIGVMGMSLGGYIASLWASLDPVAFCIPVMPLVSMTEIAWELLRKESAFRDLKKKGLSEELLDSIYRLHSPLTYQLQIDRNRALLIAGIADRIIPSRQSKMLWEHWRMPEIHWIRGGHLEHFKRSRAFLTIVHFLEGLGLANTTFR